MGNLVCLSSKNKKEIIELEIYKHDYIDEKIEFDSCCSICMIYKQNQETKCKVCGFTSCALCTINWIKTNNERITIPCCPICRNVWCINFKHDYIIRKENKKQKYINKNEHQVMPFSPVM